MCNAKCPYCAQFRLKQDKHFGEIISPILFEQIVDYLFEIGIIYKNTSPISLYNWGEVFLNPKINDILRILKNKKLKANISSNFIVVPDIDKELLPVIDNVNFSLSGFSQDSYGRIHGASLNKVLNNFDNFYEYIHKFSPKTIISISWHRYLFNEKEFWDAYKYFNRPGIFIGPGIAYLADGVKMRDFLRGRLSKDEIEKTEKDVFLDRINKSVIYHKRKSKNYYCPQWDNIVIDESGQLLSCCCYTRYDSDYVLGKIVNMSAEEIWSKKLSNPLCNDCISSGFARYVHNPDFSWPPWLPEGGLYGLKIKFYREFRWRSGQLLRKLPYGEKIIRIINPS